MKKVSIIFKSDEQFAEWLKKEAKKRKMTKSDMIREALKQVLEYKCKI